jgi:hypothetical protein
MEKTISDVPTKESLQCKLTEVEVLVYSKTIAKQCAEKGRVEDQKKEVVSEFTTKINRITAEINELSRKINNGYEYRDVECWKEYLWDDGVKNIFRKDTGELVRSEPIETWERQEHSRLFPDETQEEKKEYKIKKGKGHLASVDIKPTIVDEHSDVTTNKEGGGVEGPNF